MEKLIEPGNAQQIINLISELFPLLTSLNDLSEQIELQDGVTPEQLNIAVGVLYSLVTQRKMISQVLDSQIFQIIYYLDSKKDIALFSEGVLK